MFKRLRIAALLYVLLFVAAAQYFTTRQTTDWDAPLWIDIYTVAGDREAATRRYLDSMKSTEFAAAEEFLAREAKRYGVTLDRPFKFRIIAEHGEPLPQLDAGAGTLGILWWSLRMRWLALSLQRRSEGPSGDIVLFAVFHAPADGAALDGSTALHKGLIAVAKVFADPAARATNQIVVAHELLHTLRATDKYSPTSNAPLYPHGYADPEARPLLPQKQAELMAGRIPLDERRAEMPADLRAVVLGPVTAREIGWQPR